MANNFLNDVLNIVKNKYRKFMVLNLYINNQDDELRQLYINAIRAHNAQIMASECPDAGFDLFTTTKQNCSNSSVNKVDFGVVCEAKMYEFNGSTSTGFYMYPRSSLSKTKLRLANSVGIIDSGYRGHLIGMFDCFENEYLVEPYTRLVQVCAPDLVPIYVNLVENIEQMATTARGTGGFGSTGI